MRSDTHGKPLPSAPPPNRAEMLFGDTECDEDWSDLIYDDKRDVIRLDKIAGVDQQIPATAGNRRSNLSIVEVEFGTINRREVAFEARAQTLDTGLGGSYGFARNVG